ncbi:MAG TPA: cell wall-active antibiotics response protein [Clostridiaceae bacterium]|nr:cell wall-active antibiotics response protein [Clostridiaceae bacterium]
MKEKNSVIGVGIAIITVGIIWLLSNLGLLSWNIFGSLRVLWPLVLVVIGLNMIFKKHPLIKGLTWVALIAVLVLYSFFTAEKFKPSGQNSKDIYIEKNAIIESVELRVDLGALNLNIESTSNGLLNAASDIPDLNYSYTDNNSKRSKIYINNKKNFSFLKFNSSQSMDIKLNKDVVWDLDVNIGAINGIFDLRDIKVNSLDISMGASNLNIKFGAHGDMVNAKINSGASNINIYVPREVGLKIEVDGVLSGNNFTEAGLARKGGCYYSDNWETAESKIDLDINMGVGDVEVIYE